MRTLSRERWEALRLSDPGLAELVHRLTIGELGRRVVDLDGALSALR